MLLYTRQKNHHIIRKIKKPDVRKIGTALIIFAFIPDQGPLMHMEVMEDPEKWTNTVATVSYTHLTLPTTSRV